MSDNSRRLGDQTMRLNRYIAQAGLASRRKADELIENGNVRVNGKPVKQMGYIVQEGDRVEVNGTFVETPEKAVYYVLNKPKGYITSTEDEKSRPVVINLLTDVTARVFPIGRLDYNTSGLLLMTNDGNLAYRLSHPKHEVTKTYLALVSGALSREKLAKLRKGVDIGGYITKPAQVQIIKQGERSSLVEITIHEGKNRQVRKMFAAVGNKVVELQRTAIGEIKLGRLLEGHYRKLTKVELDYLKTL